MIHPQDANELRRLLLIDDGTEIPEAIENTYESVARIYRRACPGPLGIDMLVMVLLHTGQLPKVAPKVTEQWNAGDEVEVEFDDGWHAGKILNAKPTKAGRILVRIDGEAATSRSVEPSRIRALVAALLIALAFCSSAFGQGVTVPTKSEYDAAVSKQAVDDAARRAEIALLQKTLADFSARLAKLEETPPPIDPPPPPPPPLPPATDFTLNLIGGWRLNEPWAEGGLAIDFATMRAWTAGHDQQNNIVEYQLPAMGSGTSLGSWPLVARTKNLGTIYWNGIAKHGQQSYTCGLAFRDGLLNVNGREFYTADGGNSATIVKRFNVDGASPQLVETKTYAGRAMQAFGGGFIEGGSELLVGNGGYESGQGSRCGPCWMKADGTNVNEFPHFDSAKQLRERREGNYRVVDLWVPTPPDADGTGYLQTPKIYDGGVQIGDTVCYWITDGIGDISYQQQNESFSAQQMVWLYRYKPGEHFGKWERFPTVSGMRNQCSVRGSTISGNRVYLFVHNCWLSGGDWRPAIFVYEVK